MNRFAPLLASLLVLALCAPALAQGKFENKDTAEDRHDYTWGTRPKQDEGGYYGTDEHGDSVWGVRAAEPEPERDWYDEVIITVNPDVGYGEKTVTTTNTNSTGDVTGVHETTITND